MNFGLSVYLDLASITIGKVYLNTHKLSSTYYLVPTKNFVPGFMKSHSPFSVPPFKIGYVVEQKTFGYVCCMVLRISSHCNT